MEKREPSYTVCGYVNWSSHYGKENGSSSKELKIELPYDPAVPLLGIYPDRTMLQKAACTPTFIYTIYNSQDMEANQSSSTETWMRKMWYICTMEYSSVIKKNETMSSAATWMGLEVIVLSEIREKTTIRGYHISFI